MRVVDHLLADLREACAASHDKRKSEGVYSMADIGLSAFSLFFMQSESFLPYQRALEEPFTKTLRASGPTPPSLPDAEASPPISCASTRGTRSAKTAMHSRCA